MMRLLGVTQILCAGAEGEVMQVSKKWLPRSKAKLARRGKISQSETFVRHKIYLQNLTYITCMRPDGGGDSFISVCVCVLVCWGRGGRGLKWERKGDSDRLKKKWRKGGGDWPGAVSSKKIFLSQPHHSTLKDLLFFFNFFFFKP